PPPPLQTLPPFPTRRSSDLEPVRLNAPVRRIAQGPDGVTVDADDLVAHGSRAIVSVPPVLAVRIAYDPALPTRRDQLLQNMPAGDRKSTRLNSSHVSISYAV